MFDYTSDDETKWMAGSGMNAALAYGELAAVFGGAAILIIVSLTMRTRRAHHRATGLIEIGTQLLEGQAEPYQRQRIHEALVQLEIALGRDRLIPGFGGLPDLDRLIHSANAILSDVWAGARSDSFPRIVFSGNLVAIPMIASIVIGSLAAVAGVEAMASGLIVLLGLALTIVEATSGHPPRVHRWPQRSN